MKIFLAAPSNPEIRDVIETIREAIVDANSQNELIHSPDFDTTDITKTILENDINSADLVIAEISKQDPFSLIEIGNAQAKNKDILFISQDDSSVPIFISTHYQTAVYDRSRLKQTLYFPLIEKLKRFASGNIQNGFAIENNSKKTVFVSYNHLDKSYLERLSVHLRPFERAGQIDLWSDIKIQAGSIWKREIEIALEKAAAAILLISADFLASEFIAGNELPPLLKAAEIKGTKILPINIKPSLVHRNTQLSQFQAINDPRSPISSLNENGQEEIYVKAADAVFNLLIAAP